MEAKLSSRRMISHEPLATSAPVIPIAKPTLAFERAGASLILIAVTNKLRTINVDTSDERVGPR